MFFALVPDKGFPMMPNKKDLSREGGAEGGGDDGRDGYPVMAPGGMYAGRRIFYYRDRGRLASGSGGMEVLHFLSFFPEWLDEGRQLIQGGNVNSGDGQFSYIGKNVDTCSLLE